ncbi:MAG: methyltransferase family protein [Thermoplasmatota archaeon]
MGGPKRPTAAGRWFLRISFLLLAVFPLFFLDHFWDHVAVHFTGAIEGRVITGQWHLVLLNILAFVAFLIPLSFRRKANWKEFGIVAAFFISLFIEMYGIPFTIMFASRAFSGGSQAEIRSVVDFDLLGVGFSLTLPMIYGAVLMTIGTVIVIIGWITLYGKMDGEGLVTTGIYSVSRHPQYLGFILVIMGWIVGWTTLLTVVFGTILMVMYIRVCYKEEKEMGERHDYAAYRKNVPFLL